MIIPVSTTAPDTAPHQMPYRRFRIRWYALAVCSLAVALGTGLFGWWQVAQAHSIDADPVRVHARVVRVPSGVGTYSEVEYTVHGRREDVLDLALPAGASAGDRICLEVADRNPSAARACGERYPRPVGVALARFTLPVSLLLLVLAGLRLRRLRRAEPPLRPGRPRRRRRMGT